MPMTADTRAKLKTITPIKQPLGTMQQAIASLKP
jgi:hypothetical protein